MCLLHSNFRKIEGKCERVRTHGASPERLKPNNPMSYIYWFMPLILPVSNDIIIQLNICASVSVCVCVQTASNLFILLMCTWNKFLWNWKHIRMRWNCAAELAGMWVGGRTVVHSVDSRFPQTHTFYVVMRYVLCCNAIRIVCVQMVLWDWVKKKSSSDAFTMFATLFIHHFM